MYLKQHTHTHTHTHTKKKTGAPIARGPGNGPAKGGRHALRGLLGKGTGLRLRPLRPPLLRRWVSRCAQICVWFVIYKCISKLTHINKPTHRRRQELNWGEVPRLLRQGHAKAAAVLKGKERGQVIDRLGWVGGCVCASSQRTQRQVKGVQQRNAKQKQKHRAK